MDVLPFPYTGFPSPAGEWVEPSLNLHNLLILHPATTFFVRVKGDAMVGAGIHDDDIVGVDRTPELADQQVIVAILGDTCTIRRLEVLPGSIVLHAAHPAYLPLDVTHRLDFHVWGVVTFVIHPLLASVRDRFGRLGS